MARYEYPLGQLGADADAVERHWRPGTDQVKPEGQEAGTVLLDGPEPGGGGGPPPELIGAQAAAVDTYR